jgi:NAD(P) transhydrogenase subunit alpha
MGLAQRPALLAFTHAQLSSQTARERMPIGYPADERGPVAVECADLQLYSIGVQNARREVLAVGTSTCFERKYAMPINELGAYVFLLAAFLGLELIRRVSPLLHTPLMSLTNAISAIAVVGAIVVAGQEEATTLSRVLGFVAVTAATINAVSGYLITDRMLKMFKKRDTGK